jgi:hypothetical protein
LSDRLSKVDASAAVSSAVRTIRGSSDDSSVARKPNRKRRRDGVLADHHRRKKVLVPPLMAVGPMRDHSWHREMLPDFLWIALMLGRRSDWGAAYRALDVLDRFVPDGPQFADGRLSTFALIPEGSRDAARLALRTEAPHALPSTLGHALGLYPACPAIWLYEDWLVHHEPDASVGVPLLRSLVADNADKYSVRSTRLRMAAFSRRVTHGRLRHPGTGVHELIPKYPSGLTDDEQGQVESAMRAMWLASFSQEVVNQPQLLDWPRAFWRRSRELVACHVAIHREETAMPETDGPLDPEPLMQVSEMHVILVALDRLGERLRTEQMAFVKDPESDEPNEVLLGLASRMYRLLSGFLARPSAWVPDTAALHLRPLVDARILAGWLLVKDDPALFEAYRAHGLGYLKLLREHIKEDLGDDPPGSAREMLEHLDRRVNLETEEWSQSVNLGPFTNVSQRDMAIQAGLKREYDLSYAPLSATNHGDWSTVRDADTVLCTEPLHGAHRVGRFGKPSRTLRPEPVFAALSLARDGICDVFDRFGRDVRQDFDPVEQALSRAVYEDTESPAEL